MAKLASRRARIGWRARRLHTGDNVGGEVEWKVLPGIGAVGRAGLSLTTQRLRPTDMLKAEPLWDSRNRCETSGSRYLLCCRCDAGRPQKTTFIVYQSR